MAGRPREFDRTDALKKARDLFWRQGFESTSLSELVATLGLASARIYAAFGSKEDLFREAILDYETHEGSFATHALKEERSILAAMERILEQAIALYTQPDGPRGCMVVASATNCSTTNASVATWLAQHRKAQTTSLVDRFRLAQQEGELRAGCDPRALGDFFATFLHGLSVQARDGISAERLQNAAQSALQLLKQQMASGEN
ncbi:TetR/AcrR family transcriptional regulator [Gluconobacter frateurii]|uniref:Transcriptional regulator n=1 Tax=Gluconobacter frateurii NRIC 0228 TaxID=1307946 RepID=A0ABQ0QCW8_9PROT|nr:TetR/AcrR family transcriptional regulator [Gluconobacter frateurii]GBR13624.1 transcriptional regulator [Gluconobacter frateurii NRIC 0228]GLP89749.1 TetR family transcriptional regulator [Gluconobacter frateurii]